MKLHFSPARRATAPLALALALLATACLEKDTSSTAYVEADGTVTWVIMETGVRSDAHDPMEASREEEEYVRAHRSGSAPLSEALASMGGQDIRTELLRDRVPFSSITSARFASLEDLVRSYCEAAGWGCGAATERQGRRVTWTWTVWEVADSTDDARAIRALDDALGNLRVVLAEGRFVAARGFTFEDGSATLTPPEDDGAEPFTVSLTWEREP